MLPFHLKAKTTDVVTKNSKRFSATFIGHSSLSPTLADLTVESSPGPTVTNDGTDLSVPNSLQQGTEMLKISDKSHKRVVFRLDPDGGQISYKSRKGSVVPIEAIKEIRTGEHTIYDIRRFNKPEELEGRWMTIIYIIDGSYKTLHMVADTRDVLHLWEVSIRKLYAIRQGLLTGLGNLDLRQTIWERQYWKGADLQGDQKLELDEVIGLCKRLNVSLSKSELEQIFKEADSVKKGYLDLQAFHHFVKCLKYRPELQGIYEQISKTKNGKFDFTAFRSFMIEVQKSSFPETELKSIFVKYAHAETLIDDLTMTLDQFSSFLLSPDNTVFSEGSRGIWQDMDLPLSDYYLSSSHNTYLVGNQLIGISTIEGYIRALLHSCRTVELDLYDGDEEPMIYHGKTLTSKVSLRDICKAILKYAFVTSPYPLIISAEVHCSLHQQEKMVDIMIEEFGDKLIQAPVENRPKLEKLPSPEQLKHKILVKAKNAYIVEQLAAMKAQRELTHAQEHKEHPQRHETLTSLLSFTSSSEDDASGNTGIRHELKAKWRKFRGKEPTASPSTSPPDPSPGPTPTPTVAVTSALTKISSGASANSTGSPASNSEEPKLKMSLRLISLLVYTIGIKCHGVGRHAAVEYEPEYIFSLSENSINRLIKANGLLGDFIKHTQMNLVRVYPKGLRVNSTNYEPHRYWAAGAQVVAINWQTFDFGYTINQAMFQRNGRSGYVLKPLALRSQGDDLLKKHSRHLFDVTIISAQQLPRFRDQTGQEIIGDSIVDPYVEVTLHIPDWTTPPSLPSTTHQDNLATDAGVNPSSSPSASFTSVARSVSLKTQVVKNNGFNPVWQETLSIPFDCVGGPDGGMQNLVFVEVVVRQEGTDNGDDPIAIFCAPLGTVELGYRHLPLYDMQLTQHMFSTLFVKCDIRDID